MHLHQLLCCSVWQKVFKRGTDAAPPPTLQLPKVKSHPGYALLLDTVESFVDILGPRQLANVFWAVRDTATRAEDALNPAAVKM